MGSQVDTTEGAAGARRAKRGGCVGHDGDISIGTDEFRAFGRSIDPPGNPRLAAATGKASDRGKNHGHRVSG